MKIAFSRTTGNLPQEIDLLLASLIGAFCADEDEGGEDGGDGDAPMPMEE